MCGGRPLFYSVTFCSLTMATKAFDDSASGVSNPPPPYDVSADSVWSKCSAFFPQEHGAGGRHRAPVLSRIHEIVSFPVIRAFEPVASERLAGLAGQVL